MTSAAVSTKHVGWRRREVVNLSGLEVAARPLGASFSSALAVLVAAWGGLAVFIGPDFSYRPTSGSAWDWTTQNWLLHVVPAAVGVAAGLMLIAGGSRRRRRGHGGALEIPALLMVAAGAWFVVGPILWPTFESSTPFVTGVSSARAVLNQLGSSMGPGLLITFFGGMALKAGIARPAVAVNDAAAVSATDGSGEAPARNAEAPVVDPNAPATTQ